MRTIALEQSKSLMSTYNKVVNSIVNLRINPYDSDKLKAQKAFHNSIGILMCIGGFVFGGISLFFKLKVVSCISLSYVILIIFNFIYYGISGNFKTASFLQILFTILVPFSFHIIFGKLIPSGMIILWILLPIFSSIAVSGLKHTIRWFFFVAAFFLLSLFIGNYFNSYTINVDEKIIQLFFDLNAIIISGVLISIIVFFIKNRDDANDELEKLAVSLEGLVTNRTIELKDKIKLLTETEEELRQNNEELISANDNINRQKKEIERIYGNLTDSLNLTRIIQEAMLTRKDLIDSFLNEYFIIFQPKDQVSGDFYYLNKIENKLIFTVADCTGHGISGGFLTVLGISNLHEIIKKKNIRKPSEALAVLRDRFINFGLEMHIGLDIALCILDTKTNVLEYSGANNPLVLIRDNELIEFRANRNPVSFYCVEEEFKNYKIQLKNNDIIHLFSDGFKDQFGGKLNRKFTNKRFKDLLLNIHKKPMHLQKNILLNTLNNWQGYSEQIDDITILSIKWEM